MIPEILIKGALKFVIGTLVKYCTINMFYSQIADAFPEGLYGYTKKRKNYIKKAITNVIYFIPVLGTIELVVDFMMAAGCIGVIIWVSHNPKNLEELAKKTYDNITWPDEREKELESGKNMHKQITESLKLDGLTEKEIKKEIKEVKKENPYVKENMDKDIKKNQIRVQNLLLLDEMKDYLKNPSKAYNFTLNKRIEFADVNDNEIIIGVSKIDKENAKILTKKFKLKD